MKNDGRTIAIRVCGDNQRVERHDDLEAFFVGFARVLALGAPRLYFHSGLRADQVVRMCDSIQVGRDARAVVKRRMNVEHVG